MFWLGLALLIFGAFFGAYVLILPGSQQVLALLSGIFLGQGGVILYLELFG